jgi:hypothetical protein
MTVPEAAERRPAPRTKSKAPGRRAPPLAADLRPADEWSGEMRAIGGSKSKSFNVSLLGTVLQTLWLPASLPEESREARIKVAAVALMGHAPRDEIEGMIAGQAVALHAAAMECFRRAMIPEQPADMASRLRRDGANLARAAVEMTEAIERRRGNGPRQVVRVERVVVQEGGQAIVGSVSTTKAPLAGGVGGDV